jgi:hypothetical protein
MIVDPLCASYCISAPRLVPTEPDLERPLANAAPTLRFMSDVPLSAAGTAVASATIQRFRSLISSCPPL